jgi:hypothetical protein
MKIKEIDVWVHKDFHKRKDGIFLMDEKQIYNKEDYIKAKLTVEIPDKKVELYESDIRKAIENSIWSYRKGLDTLEDCLESAMKELGLTDE